MTQDEIWLSKWQKMVAFIEVNHRNPSRYVSEERGAFVNWFRHNRKLMNAGVMKEVRIEKFKELVALHEKYKHVNQWR